MTAGNTIPIFRRCPAGTISDRTASANCGHSKRPSCSGEAILAIPIARAHCRNRSNRSGGVPVRTSMTRRAATPTFSPLRRRAPRRSRPPRAIIPWPPVLCDPRFAYERATVEAPFRRSLQGQGNPAAEDYQGIIDAVEQMKAILRQMTAEISVREGLSAERFLDQLAAEAREEAHVKLASASSEPFSFAPAAGRPDRRPE